MQKKIRIKKNRLKTHKLFLSDHYTLIFNLAHFTAFGGKVTEIHDIARMVAKAPQILYKISDPIYNLNNKPFNETNFNIS